MKHDRELEKALGIDDLMRVRIQRFDGASDETLLPNPGPDGPLAVSIEPGRRLSVSITQPSANDVLHDLIASLSSGQPPQQRQKERVGVAIAVVEGPEAVLDDVDAATKSDSGVILTLYTISFAELMHRVLHHHLSETCPHDPV